MGGSKSRVSLFATYAATMSSPNGNSARSALVLEDPDATLNIIMHKFSRILQLPIIMVNQSLRVLGH